jgi:hypothetical protein
LAILALEQANIRPIRANVRYVGAYHARLTALWRRQYAIEWYEHAFTCGICALHGRECAIAG